MRRVSWEKMTRYFELSFLGLAILLGFLSDGQTSSSSQGLGPCSHQLVELSAENLLLPSSSSAISSIGPVKVLTVNRTYNIIASAMNGTRLVHAKIPNGDLISESEVLSSFLGTSSADIPDKTSTWSLEFLSPHIFQEISSLTLETSSDGLALQHPTGGLYVADNQSLVYLPFSASGTWDEIQFHTGPQAAGFSFSTVASVQSPYLLPEEGEAGDFPSAILPKNAEVVAFNQDRVYTYRPGSTCVFRISTKNEKVKVRIGSCGSGYAEAPRLGLAENSRLWNITFAEPAQVDGQRFLSLTTGKGVFFYLQGQLGVTYWSRVNMSYCLTGGTTEGPVGDTALFLPVSERSWSSSSTVATCPLYAINVTTTWWARLDGTDSTATIDSPLCRVASLMALRGTRKVAFLVPRGEGEDASSSNAGRVVVGPKLHILEYCPEKNYRQLERSSQLLVMPATPAPETLAPTVSPDTLSSASNADNIQFENTNTSSNANILGANQQQHSATVSTVAIVLILAVVALIIGAAITFLLYRRHKQQQRKHAEKEAMELSASNVFSSSDGGGGGRKASSNDGGVSKGTAAWSEEDQLTSGTQTSAHYLIGRKTNQYGDKNERNLRTATSFYSSSEEGSGDRPSYLPQHPQQQQQQQQQSSSFLRGVSDDPQIRKQQLVMDRKWHKMKLIGRGATGTVHTVLLDDGSTVAMKEILLSRKNLTAQVQGIEKEMAVLSDIDHPSVVKYYGALCDKKDLKLQLFMELVGGGSLGDLVRDMDNPLPEATARQYVLQIVEGLAEIHKLGVVHRDLKGDNLLLDHEGQVKIADFGTARALGNDNGASQAAQSLVGTPYFIAPEVLCPQGSSSSGDLDGSSDSGGGDGGYGVKADIWSLGITLCELLNQGRPPWPKFSNPGQAFVFISTDGNLPTIPKNASSDCADFITRCCVRDPRQRASAPQLLQHPWLKQILPPPLNSSNSNAQMSLSRSHSGSH